MQSHISYFKRNKILILMLTPGLIMLVVFKIAPVAGMVIAFQDFSAFKGILQSPFVGLKHFITMFEDPYIWTLLKNTILLAFYTLIISFPIPIIFSLLLNEIRIKFIKSSVQSISFLPYFISAAVMVSIVYMILSPSDGIVNAIITKLGMEPIFFMAEPSWFRTNYVLLHIWQTF